MIVTLEPVTDFAPVPHVRVTITEVDSITAGSALGSGADSLNGGSPSTDSIGFDAGSPDTMYVELPDGTDEVTLWWSSQGRRDRVPGAIKRPMSGRFGHLDVEAGFDVLTGYEAECFVAGASQGRTFLGNVRLPWTGDPDGCLIQQPLNPYLNAQVVNMDGSWPSMKRDAPGELVRPQGAIFPSLVGHGPRQAAQDVSVVFGTRTRQDAQRVFATLGTADDPQLPVWLIRSHQGILPRRFYAHVQSLVETDLGISDEVETWTEFSSTVAEVARPAPGLQVSLLTYDDLDASYASYGARDAAYTSYDAMDVDWSLAGAGG